MQSTYPTASKLDQTPLRRFVAKLRAETVRALEIYFETCEMVAEAHNARISGSQRAK